MMSIVWHLPSMGHYSFTQQLHNASWLHGVEVILLLCLLYILDIFCIQQNFKVSLVHIYMLHQNYRLSISFHK